MMMLYLLREDSIESSRCIEPSSDVLRQPSCPNEGLYIQETAWRVDIIHPIISMTTTTNVPRWLCVLT
jgi:hypothetical protein